MPIDKPNDKSMPLWSLFRPNDQQLQRFLDAQDALSFSYAEIGQSTDGAPQGYNLDHNRVLLGQGKEVFDAASLALSQWRMFPTPWTEIRPAGARQNVGTPLLMIARIFGVWWVNACRVVYRADSHHESQRSGFAYGTLPGHVEQGEERFMVEWDREDNVWYDLRAFSRPRYWLARLSYPITRRLQRRFVLDSQAAMRRAVASAADHRKAG
jgi:uncharacterized protein (UPF0548 family)